MKIFYGICGDGMGHAGRSIALIERLTSLGHRVFIFSFGDGVRLMEKFGYAPKVIEGLRFQQTKSGAVDGLGTLLSLRSYFARRRRSVDFIVETARSERPDLFITDFEPLTAIAASIQKTPCISLDNQHRFCHPLESFFPLYLHWYCAAAGVFVQRWIKQTSLNIVAAFHDCPPSRSYRSVSAMVRRDIASTKRRDGQHVLIYARTSIGRRVAGLASGIDAPFLAYGFDGPPADNIRYRSLDYPGFADDLASCRAVICLAGQQLLAEARFFGKPVLAIPMPNQHEQEINARYVRAERLGDFCPIGSLTRDRIIRFLDQRFAPTQRPNGVDQVLDLLRLGYG
jgi:uncharacterized protein (TIGR00661 family)